MTARAVPCNPHEGTQLLARRVGSAAGTSCCTDAEADGPGPNGSTRIIRNAIDVERLLRPAPANDPIFFALGCPHPLTMDDSNRRADLCPRSSGLIDAPDYFTSGRPSGPRTSLPSCSTASSVIIYLTFPHLFFGFCRSCQFNLFSRFLRLAACLFAFTLFVLLGHAINFSSPTQLEIDVIATAVSSPSAQSQISLSSDNRARPRPLSTATLHTVHPQGRRPSSAPPT
jgi:hypothetical protein